MFQHVSCMQMRTFELANRRAHEILVHDVSKISAVQLCHLLSQKP